MAGISCRGPNPRLAARYHCRPAPPAAIIAAVTPHQFNRLVTESLELIPSEFRRLLENVALVVEDEPSAVIRTELGLADDETLLGLYSGTPLTERSIDHSDLPDRIVIYRLPILEQARKPDNIRREVARTVIHEIAHHFGIDEDRLAELGWD